MAINPSTDITPVPAGTYVLITLRPSIAGLLDIFQSMLAAARAWIDHAPATWGTYSDPVTSSTFWGGEAAVVQIQLQQPATVAEITRLANAVSNQLTAESVVIVGMAPADPATWTATASNPAVNCGSLIGWAESPLVCMWRAVRGPVLVVVIVGLGYVAYRRGWWRDAEQLLRTPRRPIRRPRAAHATR